MNNLVMVLALMSMWVSGVVLGYLIWAPHSAFKQSFMDGLILKFIWGRFVK